MGQGVSLIALDAHGENTRAKDGDERSRAAVRPSTAGRGTTGRARRRGEAEGCTLDLGLGIWRRARVYANRRIPEPD